MAKLNPWWWLYHQHPIKPTPENIEKYVPIGITVVPELIECLLCDGAVPACECGNPGFACDFDWHEENTDYYAK